MEKRKRPAGRLGSRLPGVGVGECPSLVAELEAENQAVEDQGIGMDQIEVRNIFQKFYRTRKAEQSGEAGTGIGLSIVEQIVLQHGGKIEVASAPGKGSCFTLILPAAHGVTPKPIAAN